MKTESQQERLSYFNVTFKQNSACIFHAGELMGGMLPICMSKPVKVQR